MSPGMLYTRMPDHVCAGGWVRGGGRGGGVRGSGWAFEASIHVPKNLRTSRGSIGLLECDAAGLAGWRVSAACCGVVGGGREQMGQRGAQVWRRRRLGGGGLAAKKRGGSARRGAPAESARAGVAAPGAQRARGTACAASSAARSRDWTRCRGEAPRTLSGGSGGLGRGGTPDAIVRGAAYAMSAVGRLWSATSVEPSGRGRRPLPAALLGNFGLKRHDCMRADPFRAARTARRYSPGPPRRVRAD